MKRRPGLFNGYWWTLEGEKIRRASRADIAEAYRLWAKHADIRVAFAAQCRDFKRCSEAEAISP